MPPQVLCLGEVLQDFIADQPGLPLAEVTSWTPYFGGAPANVACGLAKLGTPTALISCIGNDPTGAEVLATLQQVGVDTQGIQNQAQAPTRRVYVIRTLAGDREFAGFGGRDTTAFADTQIQAQALPSQLFATAQYLVMGSLGLASPTTATAMRTALELAQAHGLTVMIDVNWRPIFWTQPDQAPTMLKAWLGQANLLKLADTEAEWLFGTRNPQEIAQWHTQTSQQNLLGVLVTAGAAGCDYWLRGHVGHVPALPVAVVDTTGAGDSFVAGFLHQLCQLGPASLADPARARAIVTYACACGGLTTTQAGAIAAQPTAARVEDFLQGSVSASLLGALG